MKTLRYLAASFFASTIIFSSSYAQIKASFNPPIFLGNVGSINYNSVTVNKPSDKFIIIRRTDSTAGTMTCTITPPATAAYSVVNHPLTFTIAPGIRDTIIVRFMPTSVGTFNDTISIAHNADTTSGFFHLHDPMVYALSGAGVKSDTFPKISITPSTSFNFGNVVVGKVTYNPTIFTITNASDTQRTLTGTVDTLSSKSSFIILSGDGFFSLDSGQTLQVPLKFAPKVADTLRDTVWVMSNANAQNNKIPVILRGVGIAASSYPKISASIVGGFGTTLNFPRDTIGTPAKVARIQISNLPDSGKKLLATITPPNKPFAIDSGGLSISLDSGKSTLIRLTFSPDSAGTYRDSIIIAGSNTDPATTPVKIYLTGTAFSITGPHITVVPTVISFGTKVKGSASVQMRFVIKNGGQTSADVLSGEITPPSHPFTTTNGSFNINQNDSLPVIVSFMPDTIGTFIDSVVITSNSNDNAKRVLVRLFATVTPAGAVDGRKQTTDFILAMPNPFTGKTTIHYSLQEAAPVNMKIFDILGKEVYATSQSIVEAGTHQFEWNASSFAKGSYLCQLQIGSQTRSIRIVLDK